MLGCQFRIDRNTRKSRTIAIRAMARNADCIDDLLSLRRVSLGDRFRVYS